ncbi:hypothetical protein [uncultured Alsobacter sp.]|uniref:hypothetical protein n=1 Tax=uncultured Alsobacter sp. TaxID=1748258 RepID=UPI0025E20EDF|nr:hypothetical protein [uncultured Alsobacter sp.]
MNRRLRVAAVVSASIWAAGCQQGMEGAAVSAPGVPVAVETIEGAPDALRAKVNAEVATQASARRIELVSGESAPRYRLKGYLTAYPTENGETALAFVWDVFDASKKRAQRVSTTTIARGQSQDPWQQIGETQIAKAASQSMNEVASFLAASGTPTETSDVGPRMAGTNKALGFSAAE